ncbi:hypothetical protein EV645_5899 [Kribbella rubisoli]|uniref:WD40 repeat domain-containing protein n=1 Tax=Kribbella rubisoli TaxID=3075929 RepID=A0A4V2FX73_9ACTN|nr:hypothetical protein [Kribbella rubisoli]RZU12626.1 hypothetical protein EV645_5899 [Kribbella rubisoli]
MTDTETRLRDYLHAKADTVPDSAHGPGLELDSTGTSTRRRWVPMAVAAAGIAAILTLAVPYLHGLAKSDQPSVAGLPAAGPVSTGAPRIPYAITDPNSNPDNPLDTWWYVLHDGGQTVKNPGLKGNVAARTEGGWLATTGYPDPDKSQIVVISPSGTVRPIGPLGAQWPFVSPDGRQIAVAVSKYGRPDGRVVVVDIRTGKEVSSLTVKIPNLELIGWNKDGIWMHEHGPDAVPVKVWQPGSKDVRTVGSFSDRLELTRTTNTIAQISYKGGKTCITAATLGTKGLDVKREYCFKNLAAAPYVTVSPDGSTMTINTIGVAVDIATGKATKLRLPAGTKWFEDGVFEDPDNVIVVDEAGAAQKLFRCSVGTGECKQVAIAKPDQTIRQVQP